MDQPYPKVIKLGVQNTKSPHVIEQTYLIYTPKIIKFIYKANSSTIEHLPDSLQLKEPESIYSSGKKNNKSSNGFKTPKIKLVSRKTTQLEEKSDKNFRSPFCSSKSQKIVILSKTKKKKKQTPSSSEKSEIKTELNINVVNCDLFGCISQIDKDEIYLPYHNLQKVQSRIITIPHQIQQEDRPRQIYPDIPVQAEQEQINLKVESISLSRRNKIFDPIKKFTCKRADSVEDNTFRHSISRRKRIFQRTQSQRKDYELKSSLIRRNKIFSPTKSKKQPQIQFLKKKASEMMDQSEIPEFALYKWANQQQNKEVNHLQTKNQIFKQSIQNMHLKQSFNDF